MILLHINELGWRMSLKPLSVFYKPTDKPQQVSCH